MDHKKQSPQNMEIYREIADGVNRANGFAYWRQVIKQSKTDPVLQELLEKVELYYNLKYGNTIRR